MRSHGRRDGLLLLFHLGNKLSLSFVNGEHHNPVGHTLHSQVVEGLDDEGPVTGRPSKTCWPIPLTLSLARYSESLVSLGTTKNHVPKIFNFLPRCLEFVNSAIIFH
jgi:hypothetical protein